MDTREIDRYREEMIGLGKEAYGKGLVVAWGGNVSVRLSSGGFLMTAHQAALGSLTPSDFLVMDFEGNVVKGERKTSTETKLHRAIYRSTEAGAVVHLHPPYTNVLTLRGVTIAPMTYESQLFLGKAVPVVSQEGPSVTHPGKVLEALALSNIVVLKHHGTVALGENLREAFFLTEILEEAALMTYLSRTLGGDTTEAIPQGMPTPGGVRRRYQVFSREHIERVVELVNQDEEAQRLGASTHLTVRYAIKMLETNQVYNFHFEEGKIVKVSADEDADFVIVGKREQWLAVLNGLIDPFAATTQKRLKLQKGSVGDLSRWYPPFYRIFKLWEQVPVE